MKTKEEIATYKREWALRNKDKLTARRAAKYNPEVNKKRCAVWRENNKEQKRAADATWYKNNKEKASVYAAARYIKNAVKIRARSAAWYTSNLDQARVNSAVWRKNNIQKKRDADAAWYGKNRPRVRLQGRVRAKEFRKANPEVANAIITAWRRKNPVKARAISSRRRATKLHARGTCTAEQITARVSFYGTRCAYCAGPYETIDHVIPLSRGGAHTPANIRPACRSCNSSKGAKKLSEWSP